MAGELVYRLFLSKKARNFKVFNTSTVQKHAPRFKYRTKQSPVKFGSLSVPVNCFGEILTNCLSPTPKNFKLVGHVRNTLDAT